MIELTKEYISNLIEQRGMTKAEFATKMGYSQRQYLDAVLNTQKKDINTVVKMAEALGIPLLEFIGQKETPKTVYGCIFINGVPKVVDSKQKILDLLKDVE